jgi:cobalamin biosynthesis protein CobT
MKRHKNYVVSLVVDQSYSMHMGNKTVYAAQATVLMAEVLHKVGVPFEILGFHSEVQLYKTFEQPYNQNFRRKVIEMMNETGGATNDAFALNEATYRASLQDAERIILVITDGESNTTGGKIPQNSRKRLPKHLHSYCNFNISSEIDKANSISTVIGVGLGREGSYVQNVYPQSVVSTQVDELPVLLLERIRKNIRRG